MLSDPLSIGLQAKVDAAIEAIQTLANRMSKGDRDLADELFQIGYMAAVRAARNYDVHDGGCFEDFAMTWAASMMKQELIYRQAKGADGKRNFSLVLDHRVEIEGSGFPAERDDEVRRLVLALPIVKREIVMRRMRGESIEAIAISIGMSHDRVAEIETEAHDQLRGRLAKYA